MKPSRAVIFLGIFVCSVASVSIQDVEWDASNETSGLPVGEVATWSDYPKKQAM